MKKHLKNFSLAILKLAFAFGALGYVLYKTDTGEIKDYILKSDWVYLVIAYFSMHISTILSSYRLRIYFEQGQTPLPNSYVIPAFYMNTFFNTVLPGGIGGDGYLALLFRKRFAYPALKSIRLILTSRANGLFFLNLFLYVALWNSTFAEKFPDIKLLIIVLFVLQMPVYALASKFIFKESFETFWKAGIFSFTSQVFFVVSAFFAFRAIGVTDGYFNYISLYISSSIAAIIPITPGGVGLRELIFMHGSEIIGLNPQMAVAGSLIYFSVYFAVSLTGLVFYLMDDKMHLKREERKNGIS